MGLLSKVVLTGANIIGAELVCKGLENVFSAQEQKNLEYLSRYPYCNKYIIREVKEKLSNMDYVEGFGVQKNFFVAYSRENIPMYLAYSEESFGKCKYTLIDMDSNEMAVLMAKNNKCTIEFMNNKIVLKSSEMFDKRRYHLVNSDFVVKSNDIGTEIKLQKKGCSKTIIQINKVRSDLGAKWGEYIVGCENVHDEVFTILLGIAVGTISMKSSNVLVID